MSNETFVAEFKQRLRNHGMQLTAFTLTEGASTDSDGKVRSLGTVRAKADPGKCASGILLEMLRD